MFVKYLLVFLISMVPVVELRGAIPFAASWGLMNTDDVLSTVFCYCLCILGNMLPVPFIFLFARRFLEWGKDKKFLAKICTFFLEKGKKGGEKLQAKAGRSLFFALFLFVGIPLPGTGAWTGTLAASLLDMDFKSTVLAVMSGVLLAGIIMLLASLGVFEGIASIFSSPEVSEIIANPV